jgi:hypothetical protein
MKKFTFSIILYFIATAIFGQDFTLSELINLNNYQLDNFDTYVTQKGYKYYSNENDDFCDAISYAFYVNGVEKAYISKFYYKTKKKEMISFQTTNNATYLKIKTDLKTLGFKFIETETFNETIFFTYKKGDITVSLASTVQKKLYGENVTIYEISVSKGE